MRVVVVIAGGSTSDFASCKAYTISDQPQYDFEARLLNSLQLPQQRDTNTDLLRMWLRAVAVLVHWRNVALYVMYSVSCTW